MRDSAIDEGRIVNAYTGSVRPVIGIVLVMIVIYIVVMAIVVNEVNLAFWLFNSLLFILYMLFFAVMASSDTIYDCIYENGIAWQRGSSHVFATCDTIGFIGRKDEGDSSTFGIYLNKPIQPEVYSWLDKRLFSSPVGYIRLTLTVQVPTTFRARKGNVIHRQALAETDFGKDVLSYVP